MEKRLLLTLITIGCALLPCIGHGESVDSQTRVTAAARKKAGGVGLPSDYASKMPIYILMKNHGWTKSFDGAQFELEVSYDGGSNYSKLSNPAFPYANSWPYNYFLLNCQSGVKIKNLKINIYAENSSSFIGAIDPFFFNMTFYSTSACEINNACYSFIVDLKEDNSGDTATCEYRLPSKNKDEGSEFLNYNVSKSMLENLRTCSDNSFVGYPAISNFQSGFYETLSSSDQTTFNSSSITDYDWEDTTKTKSITCGEKYQRMLANNATASGSLVAASSSFGNSNYLWVVAVVTGAAIASFTAVTIGASKKKKRKE